MPEVTVGQRRKIEAAKLKGRLALENNRETKPKETKAPAGAGLKAAVGALWKERSAAAGRMRELSARHYAELAALRKIEAGGGDSSAARKAEQAARTAKARQSKKVKALDEKIAEAKKKVDRAASRAVERSARAKGSSHEYGPYTPGGKFTFLHDLKAAAESAYTGEAYERLVRNNRIVADKRGTDLSNASGFAAPIWESDLWAEYPHEAGVLEAAIPHAPMPDAGFAAQIPALTTPTVVSPQNPAYGTTVASQDIASETVDAHLVSVAGQIDVNRQVFERTAPSGATFLGRDLLSALDADVDRQLAVGAGASSFEHVGLYNVPGATAVTYTSASPTPQELLTEIGKAMSAFRANRKAWPTHIVLSAARAAWLMSGDATTAPLFAQGGFVPNGTGADATFSSGTVLGLRALVVDSIPEDLGVGSNEDFIALWRPSDAAYASSERLFTFVQVQSSALAVRFQVIVYAYAWLARLPASVAIMTGTGLVTPSGY